MDKEEYIEFFDRKEYRELIQQYKTKLPEAELLFEINQIVLVLKDKYNVPSAYLRLLMDLHGEQISRTWLEVKKET